jgi:NAD-dependent SIR2 family protein deacetylase
MSSECEYCGKKIDREEWCDWQQGRCPHRKKPKMSRRDAVFFGTLALALLIAALLSEALARL